MRITVDRGSDTVHLRLAEGEGQADARALADGVSVDYDGAGRLVGLTIRGVSRLTGSAEAAATLVVDLGGPAPTPAARPALSSSAPTTPPPAAPPAIEPPPIASTTPITVPEPEPAAPTPATSPEPVPTATHATPDVSSSSPAAPVRGQAAVAQRPSKLLPLSMAERASLGPLTWEPDAEAAMARVPFFLRGGRRIAVVETARARRLNVITAALVEEMVGR